MQRAEISLINTMKFVRNWARSFQKLVPNWCTRLAAKKSKIFVLDHAIEVHTLNSMYQFSACYLYSLCRVLFQFNAANFLFLLLDDKISPVFAIYRMCLYDWIMSLIHAIISKIRSLSLLRSDNSVFPSPLQVQVPSSVRSAKIRLPSESTSLIIFLSYYSHFYLYLSC